MLRKILFVDDDEILQLVAGKGLAAYGDSFQVVMAKDGFEALKMLEGISVSLIVIDLQMPRMDGLSLLSHIQQSYPDIPVIIISATPKIDLPYLAAAQNIVAYFEKPFGCEELARRIIEVLQEESAGGIMHQVSPVMFQQGELVGDDEPEADRCSGGQGVAGIPVETGADPGYSTLEGIRNLLRREVGEIRGLHKVYHDPGLDQAVGILAALGRRLAFGDLRVGHVDNDEQMARLLVSGPEQQATVLQVGSEAPLTTLMDVLRYRDVPEAAGRGGKTAGWRAGDGGLGGTPSAAVTTASFPRSRHAAFPRP